MVERNPIRASRRRAVIFETGSRLRKLNVTTNRDHHFRPTCKRSGAILAFPSQLYGRSPSLGWRIDPPGAQTSLNFRLDLHLILLGLYFCRFELAQTPALS